MFQYLNLYTIMIYSHEVSLGLPELGLVKCPMVSYKHCQGTLFFLYAMFYLGYKRVLQFLLIYLPYGLAEIPAEATLHGLYS